MTNLELNKALHEWMGECWHEWPRNGPKKFVCKKCGDIDFSIERENPSYTTEPADFWQLLQKVKERDNFDDFVQANLHTRDGFLSHLDVIDFLKNIWLDMPRGASAIFDFFCKEAK